MQRRSRIERAVPGSAAYQRRQARRDRVAARGEFLAAVTPLPARRDPGPDGPTAATRLAVLARDSYRCVVGGEPATGTAGVDYHIHHRRLRSQGGGHGPENLITLCAAHHEEAHANPSAAAVLGRIVPSFANPEFVNVFWLDPHGTHRWVYLTPDGAAVDEPEER